MQSMSNSGYSKEGMSATEAVQQYGYAATKYFESCLAEQMDAFEEDFKHLSKDSLNAIIKSYINEYAEELKHKYSLGVR
jgi:hypothetical protein